MSHLHYFRPLWRCKTRRRCGKTTLARLVAKETGALLRELSAADLGVQEARALLNEAKNALALIGRCVGAWDYSSLFILPDRRTILFLDEVHCFNKAQQVCPSCLRFLTLPTFRNRTSSYPFSNKDIFKFGGLSSGNQTDLTS